ncbi:hypothetical protein Tco_1224618, partial [Tanacetum coccineum]
KTEALQAKKAKSFKASKTESSSALRSNIPTKRRRIDASMILDIADVIEEEKGFVRKGGLGREEDNIEDIVVVANDLCSSMIQTILKSLVLIFEIEQFERGISINKERYVKDLLRKYDKISSSVNTPIMPPNMLGPDLNGKAVNESQYRAMFSAEAEDIDAAGCCVNILWIKSRLTDYGDIEFHFIPAQYQLDDILINLLDKPSFKRLIDELGMLNIDSKPKASVLTEEN